MAQWAYGDDSDHGSTPDDAGAGPWNPATVRAAILVVITGLIAATAAWLVAWVAGRLVSASTTWSWAHRHITDPPAAPDPWDAALLAFVAALAAAGAWWAFTTLTPQPRTFFRPTLWLCVAVIVIAVVGSGGWLTWAVAIATTAAPAGLISMGISSIGEQYERERANDDTDR